MSSATEAVSSRTPGAAHPCAAQQGDEERAPRLERELGCRSDDGLAAAITQRQVGIQLGDQVGRLVVPDGLELGKQRRHPRFDLVGDCGAARRTDCREPSAVTRMSSSMRTPMPRMSCRCKGVIGLEIETGLDGDHHSRLERPLACISPRGRARSRARRCPGGATCRAGSSGGACASLTSSSRSPVEQPPVETSRLREDGHGCLVYVGKGNPRR